MEKLTVLLRVESGAIRPFTFRATCNPAQLGESMEFKSSGAWSNQEYRDAYPASFHVTVPIGCGLMPVSGDFVKVTIERATRAEMDEEYNQRFVRAGNGA